VNASIPSDGPLDPHQGNAYQKQGYEVRDHERAAAVIDTLDGKTQEIAEAHGICGHGKDKTHTGSPLFSGLGVRFVHTERLTKKNSGFNHKITTNRQNRKFANIKA
jgi:hypothetical protein